MHQIWFQIEHALIVNNFCVYAYFTLNYLLCMKQSRSMFGFRVASVVQTPDACGSWAEDALWVHEPLLARTRKGHRTGWKQSQESHLFCSGLSSGCNFLNLKKLFLCGIFVYTHLIVFLHLILIIYVIILKYAF